MSDIKIKFGVPEHGWLPINFVAKEYVLDMDVSDVPVDPIQLLIVALAKALSGFEGEVWWHLEPHGYYFTFIPEKKEYRLKIQSAQVSFGKEDRSFDFVVSGSLEEIILPFWRALREFESRGYSEPAWPDFPKSEMIKLTELIENRKG